MNPFFTALIGHPLGHSVSPFIHKRLFSRSKIDYEYRLIDTENLGAELDMLMEMDGFNITIPYKQRIIPYLTDMDKSARLCGSVNTVKVSGGKLYGYTTDGLGCIKALYAGGVAPKGELLILGNGGAARAMAFAAAEIEDVSSITLAHRMTSADAAKNLAAELRSNMSKDKLFLTTSYEELENGNKTYSLLMNATSVGMHPNSAVSPVHKKLVERCETVFDAVYNPAVTQLLDVARELGKKTVGGIGMLVYQAAAAHEIWYGAEFKEEDMQALCIDAISELELQFG